MIGVDWGRTNDFTVFSVSMLPDGAGRIGSFLGVISSTRPERLHGGATCLVLVPAEHNAMGGPLTNACRPGYARLMGKPLGGAASGPWGTTNASKSALVGRSATGQGDGLG